MLRWPVSSLVAAAFVVGCSLQAPVQPAVSITNRQWSKCETLVKLTDKRIDESSGICASRIQDGVYYTHNDSGDTARFFKFNREGKILAVFNVTNAFKAEDWEDIASASIEGKPYIFCGDIGDNAGVRKRIYVYRVPEPSPLTPEDGSDRDVQADRIYTLTYPDEPHNAETLMVNPRTEDLYIVTKAAKKPSAIFKLPHKQTSGSYVLEKVGEIQLGESIRESKLITGGDISPDSKHIVLRTYMAAWEFDAPRAFDEWFKVAPRRIQTNFEFQGEGICYSRDGGALLTTSEGSPCLVSEAKLTGQ